MLTMTITFFDAPHRPDTTGVRYTLWTREHDKQTADLPPCAAKLYRWLLENAAGGIEQEVELEDFQKFSVSPKRPKGYHIKHIIRSFAELLTAGLVLVKRKYTKRILRLVVRHVGVIKQIEQKCSVQDKKVPQETEVFPPTHLSPDSVVPNNREFRDYQKSTTLTQSEVVDFSEQEEGVSTNLSVEDKNLDEPLHKETEDIPEGNPSFAVPRLEDEKRQLLAEIRSLQIPLTPYLQQLVWRSSVAAIKNALAAFIDQQEKGNVRVSAAFMIRAIECGFQPVQEANKKRELEEFNVWYEQNKHRIWATYSRRDVTGLPEGQIGVMLRGSDRWIYWREVDYAEGGGGK